MNRTWGNYGCNTYLKTLDGIEIRCNMQTGNNGWNTKPLVHVNPKLVNYPYPYSKLNNVPSKKIHVNPNFKHPYFPSADDTAQSIKIETGSVHINPHFRKSNINLLNDSEKCTSVSVLNPIKKQERNDTFKINSETSSENNIQNERLIGYKVHPLKKSCNSNYFWSKNGKTSSIRVSTAPSSCSSSPGVNTGAFASRSTPSMTSIKTRHKIVKTTTTSSSSSSVCQGKFKYKFENPYKVINDGKTRCEKREIYGLVKKNISRYSKTNSVATEIKKENKMTKKIPVPNRTSYINRITNLIRTKYINQGRVLNCKKQMRLSNKGKYKLDKRKRLSNSKRNLKKPYDKVPNNRSVQRDKRTISNYKSTPWKSDERCLISSMTWRKSKINLKPGKSYPNKSVINIGGIMYKSTSNKLTRTKDKKQGLQCTKEYKSKENESGTTNHVVYVRGEKFSLGEDGKTLIRHIKRENGNEIKPVVKRVDIGGVTYIQKSNNLLIQTKTHQARNFVNHAKHKSIALLSNLHKRSNMPCMIYHKFGICRRHNKGMCVHVHDPKNVALCKKFLKGECRDALCLLSHNIIDEKIATCHFFLKGKCTRENCHFLHVKVNKKAGICRDFLQGFCPLGQNCVKRHVHQCPDFEDKEFCIRGVKCPYPHKKNATKKRKIRKSVENYKITKFKLTKKSGDKSVDGIVKTGSKTTRRSKGEKRKNDAGKGRKRKLKKKMEECKDQVPESCIPKRIKLSDLPFFIPLNS